MSRRAWQLAAIVAAAALLAACGSSSDPVLKMTLAALRTPQPSAPSVPPARVDTRCPDMTASLRPPAVMPAPGAMPRGSFMARIERSGRLTVGVDENTLLFSYFNPLRRQFQGFEVDLLREVARAIFGDPKAIRFTAVTPAERVADVQNGSVDIVADAMTITCERRKQVDFSTVYFNARQRTLVPLNVGIRSRRDLGGKRVCAAQGSTSIQTLLSLQPRPIAVARPQRIDCLVALQQGDVDAISTDDAILLGFRAQDPYTRIRGPTLAREPYGMAISKAHPDFVRFVNGVLARLRADGTWRAIYQRWLGKYAAIPAPPVPQYVGSG
jgi:polar amino acid transport system substrate-binding protein